MRARRLVTSLEKLGHCVQRGWRDAVGAHRRFVLPRGQCPEREAFCFPQPDPEAARRTLGLSE